MTSDRSRVVIFGYYGAGNAGDEAILAALLDDLRTALPGVEVTVPGDDPAALVREHGVHACRRDDLGAILDAVEACDLVICGGGGLFHDYSQPDLGTWLTPEHWGLTYFCGVPWLAAGLGIPVALCGVGVGPLEGHDGRTLVGSLASRAASITVRDEASARLLATMGVKRPVEVTADQAWRLPIATEPVASILARHGIDEGPWLGVSVRPWPFGPPGWEEALAVGVAEYARRAGLGVLLLPFQRSASGEVDDVRLANGLAARLEGVRTAVLGPCSPAELAAALSGCRLALAMRLHALLFALRARVPAVALAYDPKVAALAAEVGPSLRVLNLGELPRLAEALARAARSAAAQATSAAALEERQAAAAAHNVAAAVALLGSRRPAQQAAVRTVEALRRAVAVFDSDPGARAALAARRTARAALEGPDTVAQVQRWSEEHAADRALLAEAHARASALESELAAAQGFLDDLRSEREAAVKTLTARLAAIEQRVADVAAEREATVTELNARLAASERRIAEMAAEREVTVAALTARLSHAEAEIERWRAAAQGAAAEVERWSASAQAARAEVEHWRVAHDDARAGIEWLRSELERAHSTKAWRLAAAYWRLRARVGGFRGQVRRWLGRRPPPPAAAPAVARVKVEASETPTRPVATPPASPADLPPFPAGRYDLIVLSIIDWDFRFQRPQQIARQYARAGHRVFFLSTTVFLTDPASPAFELRGKGERVAELRIRNRRALDIYGGRLEEEDLTGLEVSFRGLAAGLAVSDAVVMVEIPFWAPLAERLRERLGWRVVYDCMDEWTNFPGFGDHVLSLEAGLVNRSDVTVVSADKLLKKWEPVARRLVLARNGVDLDFYRGRYGPNDLLGEVSHPVIGYYGALASWVDVALVEKVARRFSGATIILAGGHFDVDLEPLKRLPNVRLLGQRPYHEMPRLLWHFDACMIPFLVNDITEATNPVKFYEYVSQGKPVVAPELTELKPFAELCYLARGHDDFLAKLEQALAEPPDDPRRARRAALAETNDWRERYGAIDAVTRESWPLVSVVVVTFNGLQFTRDCLRSLLEQETWPRLEVIVVDNGSTDGTPAFLEQRASGDPRMRVIRNVQNRGFAAANNQGLMAARGDVLVLLNNDTVVPPGLLGRLVRHLDHDHTLGLLCPTTNFCGNEAKVAPGYAEISGLPAFAAQRAAEHAGRIFDLVVAAMYCVAMRRDTFDRVGALDETYGIGMFEDDDYAMRMRAEGLRVACAEDAYVHHVGQGAFKTLSPATYDTLWKTNQAYFERKWGVAWKPHTTRADVAAPVSKIGLNDAS